MTGAKLRQKTGDRPGHEIVLRGPSIIGRSSTVTIPVNDEEISKQHAEFQPRGEEWFLTDLQSKNGTWLNGQKLTPMQSVRIQAGNLIRVGKTEFVYEQEGQKPQAQAGQGGQRPGGPPPVPDLPGPNRRPGVNGGNASPGGSPQVPDLPSQVFMLRPVLTVGRDPACDIVLSFPNVSRRHCQIVQGPQGYFLEDMNSRTGTFLNGQRVTQRQKLRTGDEVRIGLTQLVFRDGKLEQFELNGVVRIDAERLFQVLQKSGKPLTLLHDVSFVIQPKEFVAIVGASGAGKSTLLNAMTGLRPASTGSLLINGVDFYSHLELFRAAIGYVPQEDIVHRELTVRSVLYYAAKLRLPPDTDDAEIEKLIDGALKELELSHRKDASVSTLSGGERKRVNVGVELLTRPSLLFLDEPTSGLDPGLELKFIELIKRLTHEGRTIVMVTHATSSIAACDKLLFLARGGRIAFFGRPDEALAYFQVKEFADVYRKVNEGGQPPEYWEQLYRRSEYYQRHILQAQASAPQHRQGETVMVAQKLGVTKPKVSPFEQFPILCRRYIDVLRGDTRNLMFLLAQAPIIALILIVVFKSTAFDPKIVIDPNILRANPTAQYDPVNFPAAKGSLLLFCMVISALLFGIVNASREITKESAIYRRERLINLKAMPYLASKVAILSVLCLIQSVMLFAIIWLKIKFQAGVGGTVEIFMTLLMATLCGMLLGLFISAIATTNDQAMSLVPVAILPQIIFSGLIDLESIKIISKIMPSYWAYGVSGHLTELNDKLITKKDLFDVSLPGAWIALIFIGVLYAGLAYWALLRQDRARV